MTKPPKNKKVKPAAVGAEDPINLTLTKAVKCISGLEAMISTLTEARETIQCREESGNHIIQINRLKSVDYYNDNIDDFSILKDELIAEVNKRLKARQKEEQS